MAVVDRTALRSTLRIAQCVVLLVLAALHGPAAAAIDRVTVFFIPWDVLTRSDLSEGNVRTHGWVTIEITKVQLCEQFVGTLTTDLDEDRPRAVRDLRLVVDVRYDDGHVRTLVATYFDLLDKDSGRSRPLDDAFRARVPIALPTWGR